MVLRARPPHRCRSELALGALLLAVVLGAVGGSVGASAAETKIVGGNAVSIADYPYQVLLLINQAEGTFQCGGSIRDATHVVTAAHCVVDEDAGFHPRIVAPGAVTVGYSSATRSTMQTVGVSRVSVARGFERDGTAASDAALLTLASPIDLAGDAEAEAIPFASDAELGDGSAFATGWGATSEGGSATTGLRGVELRLQPDSRCEQVYGPVYDRSVMLCAGGEGNLPAGNRDTCVGDSGGPLAIDVTPDTPPSPGDWRLVGITSFGIGCGRPNLPGVYARVQSSVLLPFLSAANPVAPPGVPAANPNISGSLHVGGTVTCNAPPVAGATPTRFVWLVTDGSSLSVAEVTEGPALMLPPRLAGAFLICDVRYENEGGFRYSNTPPAARVGPVLAGPAPQPPPTPLPPPPAVDGGASTNPPVADTARPRARVAKVSCLRRRCKIKVDTTDVGGLVRGLSAKLTFRVKRCRTSGGRPRCRTRTRTKRLGPRRSPGGFTITTRLARGRYTLSAVATDTSDNRSSTARKTFRVR